MKTYVVKKADVVHDWYVVDAAGQTLGRLASEVAKLLMGKGKPTFTRNMDVGDFVVVINASKIKVTGNKLDNKLYYRHSGYPGGFRSVTLRTLMERHPERAVEYSVRGMLPSNRLGDAMYSKLKVYAGAEHPHAAQVPKVYELSKDEG
jgi:large subunit ribosomal protein L13